MSSVSTGSLSYSSNTSGASNGYQPSLGGDPHGSSRTAERQQPLPHQQQPYFDRLNQQQRNTMDRTHAETHATVDRLQQQHGQPPQSSHHQQQSSYDVVPFRQGARGSAVGRPNEGHIRDDSIVPVTHNREGSMVPTGPDTLTGTVTTLTPLLELQQSIALCFEDVQASFRNYPEVASEIRLGTTMCRVQVLENSKMLQRVEQTANLVLNLFPDLELAVEEGAPELASNFFGVVKQWIGELRQSVKEQQLFNHDSMMQIQRIVEKCTVGFHEAKAEHERRKSNSTNTSDSGGTRTHTFDTEDGDAYIRLPRQLLETLPQLQEMVNKSNSHSNNSSEGGTTDPNTSTAMTNGSVNGNVSAQSIVQLFATLFGLARRHQVQLVSPDESRGKKDDNLARVTTIDSEKAGSEGETPENAADVVQYIMKHGSTTADGGEDTDSDFSMSEQSSIQTDYSSTGGNSGKFSGRTSAGERMDIAEGAAGVDTSAPSSVKKPAGPENQTLPPRHRPLTQHHKQEYSVSSPSPIKPHTPHGEHNSNNPLTDDIPIFSGGPTSRHKRTDVNGSNSNAQADDRETSKSETMTTNSMDVNDTTLSSKSNTISSMETRTDEDEDGGVFYNRPSIDGSGATDGGQQQQRRGNKNDNTVLLTVLTGKNNNSNNLVVKSPPTSPSTALALQRLNDALTKLREVSTVILLFVLLVLLLLS